MPEANHLESMLEGGVNANQVTLIKGTVLVKRSSLVSKCRPNPADLSTTDKVLRHKYFILSSFIRSVSHNLQSQLASRQECNKMRKKKRHPLFQTDWGP